MKEKIVKKLGRRALRSKEIQKWRKMLPADIVAENEQLKTQVKDLIAREVNSVKQLVENKAEIVKLSARIEMLEGQLKSMESLDKELSDNEEKNKV